MRYWRPRPVLEVLAAIKQLKRTLVMLSLPKHLYRTVERLSNGAVEMLRQTQHDQHSF